MRSLRDKRDLEILNQDLEEINLDSDYQKKLPENKVLNIKYLGKIEINNEPKDIYLVLEQKQKDDGSKIETIKTDITAPFVVILPNNAGNVTFLDAGGNTVDFVCREFPEWESYYENKIE